MRLFSVACMSLCILFSQAKAYELIQTSAGNAIPWAGNSSTMLAAWDSTYDAAFSAAQGDWNNRSKFSFNTATGGFIDPCLSDGVSTYKFSTTNCGLSWNSSTLAITYSKFTLSPAHTFEADIVYNSSNFAWGVHDQSQSERSDIDFRRVTVHELGHALGMAHSSVSPAIMEPVYSNTILSLKTDDVNGLVALYGALPPSKKVPAGVVSALLLLLN